MNSLKTVVKDFAQKFSERSDWQEHRDSSDLELGEQSQESSQTFCTNIFRETSLAGTQRQFRPRVGLATSRQRPKAMCQVFRKARQSVCGLFVTLHWLQTGAEGLYCLLKAPGPSWSVV